MKKLLIIIGTIFIVENSYAQVWQKVGANLTIIDGDTLPINNAFSKYTTSFLKYIKGNVGISTNTHDSVLVYDDFTRSIKKKLIAGGGGSSGWSLSGNAGTVPANNFIGTTDAQPLKFRTNNNVVGTFGTDYSIAMGLGSVASNNYATAIGGFNSALGFGSTSFGYGCYSSGVYSVSTGLASYATGPTSFASGNSTEASGASTASLGEGTKAKSFGETAIGLFNVASTPSSTTAWVGTDVLLSVGNGTADAARSNAVTVFKNGNVKIGGGTNANAIFEVVNNTKGSIPAPFNDERFVGTNVISPTKGLHVIDSVSGILMRYNGIEWVRYDLQQFNQRSICIYNTFQGFATQSIIGGQHLDIANGSAFENFTLNVSTITQDGWVFSVFNEEATYAATFTGQTVYQLNGTTVITSIPVGSHWTFRRMNGKIRKTN